MQSAKTQEEIGILNKPISFKEIESIINVLTQKAPNTDKFSHECYQIVKGELNTSSLQLLGNKQRKYFLTHSLRSTLS